MCTQVQSVYLVTSQRWLTESCIWASKWGFSLDGTQNVEYVDHVFTSPSPSPRSVSWSVIPPLQHLHMRLHPSLALLQSARLRSLLAPGAPAGRRWRRRWRGETVECDCKNERVLVLKKKKSGRALMTRLRENCDEDLIVRRAKRTCGSESLLNFRGVFKSHFSLKLQNCSSI